MTRRLLLALAAAALALPAARAGDPLVQRVYPVADLVVPLPDASTPHAAPARAEPRACPAGSCPGAACSPAPAAAATRHQELVKLIVNTVAPETWDKNRGQGTIDYMPIGMALVVNNTRAVHEQVVDLLEALRRLQDQQITFEVRLLSVSDACYDALGRPGAAGGVGLLSDAEMRNLLTKAQGDCRTELLQSPRVTALDGQEATVRIEDQKMFVVGVDRREINGQTVYAPRQESLSSGVSMALRGSILPGRGTVAVRAKVEVTRLQDEDALFPITTSVTPAFEGGAQGQPIPFTQFIQQPTQTTCGITKMAAVPAGRTAVFCAGRRSREVGDEAKVPVLGDLPLLGEFFTARTRRTETDNLVVLLTPRVVPPAGGEEADAAPAKPADRVRMEMTLFSACDCFWAQCEGPAAKLATDNLAFLGDDGGEIERRLGTCGKVHVYGQPIVVTQAGRPASVCVGGDDRVTMSLTPTVSADGRWVHMTGTVWGLEAAAGTPVLPSVSLPCGKAVIYKLGRGSATGETLYALMTPSCARSCPQAGEESEARDRKLAELMAEYCKACAEGRADDARTLAGRCLKIDPTCFGR